MNNFKICSKCKRYLPFERFHKSAHQTAFGIMCQCKDCNALHQRNYRKKNLEKVRAAARRRYAKNREKIKVAQSKYRALTRDERLKKMRDYWTDIRLKVFNGYGNKCACCGDTNKEFFAIDHKEGGGTEEKKKYGTRPFYKKLILEGFPTDKYQILCHNCNMSLGFYGYCPHHPEIKRPLHNPFKKKRAESVLLPPKALSPDSSTPSAS